MHHAAVSLGQDQRARQCCASLDRLRESTRLQDCTPQPASVFRLHSRASSVPFLLGGQFRCRHQRPSSPPRSLGPNSSALVGRMEAIVGIASARLVRCHIVEGAWARARRRGVRDGWSIGWSTRSSPIGHQRAGKAGQEVHCCARPSHPASRADSHHSACPFSLQLKPWECWHSSSVVGRLAQSSGCSSHQS